MGSSPMAWIIPQFFTNDGEMAAGYQLFSYVVNSLTKQNTYTTSALITANDNPLILDQYGRAPIFLALQNYRFILAPPDDTDPPVNPVWDEDYVPAYATGEQNFDISGVVGEDTDSSHNVVYLSDGNDGKTPGLWYLVNALVPASSSLAITIGVAQAPIIHGETGTIRLVGKSTGFVSFNLTPGTTYYASDVSNGEVTATPPTNAIVVGKADTISSLVLEPNWGFAGVGVIGMLSAGAQSIAGLKTFTVQPKTDIGTETIRPGSIGGVYFSDVASHTATSGSTDTVLSTTTIPANMLNEDGKAVVIRFGSTTASTGGGLGKTIELDMDGTQTVVYSNLNASPWLCWGRVIRTSASTAEVSFYSEDPTATGLGAYATVAIGDYGSAIVLRTLGTTAVGATVTQTYFVVYASG